MRVYYLGGSMHGMIEIVQPNELPLPRLKRFVVDEKQEVEVYVFVNNPTRLEYQYAYSERTQP